MKVGQPTQGPVAGTIVSMKNIGLNFTKEAAHNASVSEIVDFQRQSPAELAYLDSRIYAFWRFER
jgi:hypothetical protein